MRINKYVAQATGMSRRAADDVLAHDRITVNDHPAKVGDSVKLTDQIKLDGKFLHLPNTQTILLNKPIGYVCSRNGQGSKTIYHLLPESLHTLKPIGRLDKDSSGLLLMTNDGNLAHELSHPSYQKNKVYTVTVNKKLTSTDLSALKSGVTLEDGVSKFDTISHSTDNAYTVTLHEGRNRQIRRSMQALGYRVVALQRIQFGNYFLDGVEKGRYKEIKFTK